MFSVLVLAIRSIGKMNVEGKEGFVFDSLKMYNYKMHKYTELDLSNNPITVISGANGSGKTQILESLILSVGQTPSRVALSKNTELIGPFDDHSTIILSLCNPLTNGSRLFQIDDPDIEHILSHSNISIETEIRKEGTIKRQIHTGTSSKSVTRRQVQRIMKSIGIHDETMFNFTEEGFLDAFANDSPYKKLDNLLEATGLKETYERYKISKSKLEEKQRQVSPLLLQLEREKNNLQKMKDDYEQLEQRTELIEKFDILKRELAWYDYLKLKKAITENEDKIQSLRERREKIKQKENTLLKKKQTLGKTLEEKQAVFTETKYELDLLEKNKNRKEGKIEEKKNIITNYESKLQELERRREKFVNISSEESIKKKAALIKSLDTIKITINDTESNIHMIQKNIHLNKEKILQLEDLIDKRSRRFGQLRERERKTLEDVVRFKSAIEQTGYTDEIIGPVFEVIKIKDSYKELEKPITTVIGTALFHYVATSHDAYERAKQIYDGLSSNYKLNITVGRVLEEEGPIPDYKQKNQILENKPSGVIDMAINLIEGPFHIMYYLRKFVRTCLAYPNISSNLLTDFAQKNRVNVLTTDCNSFFLHRGAFTRPPPVSSIKVGVEIEKYKSISQLRHNKSKLERENESLKEKETLLRSKKISLFKDQDELKRKLNPWSLSKNQLENQILLIEERRQEFLTEVAIEKNAIKTIENKIYTIEKKMVKLSELIQTKKLEKERISGNMSEINSELEGLAREKQSLVEKKSRYSSELQEFNSFLPLKMKKAEESGEKPSEIRENRDTISKEYYSIKGQLELINITPEISEETIKSQQKKVENLIKTNEGEREHLKNLEKDLQKRLEEWETGIINVVEDLNAALSFLLADVFETIFIKISNYRDQRRAELHIEAQTKGDNRSYRQLSGGEKTLIAQAIILGLHQNHCPIHAIDEFTQKLDYKNKAHAFSMVLSLYNLSKEEETLLPQFILITPTLDNVKLSPKFSHHILIESLEVQ